MKINYLCSMKRLSIILLFVFCAACGLESYAQSKSADLLNVFVERTAKVGKKKLKFREVLTARQDTAAPAIVIFLHGGSGAGNDNKRQMETPGVRHIYDYLNEHAIKAYFLVPQCDDDASWSGFNPPPRHRGRPSPGMQRPQEPVKCPSYNKYVKALADHYVRELGADSTRIYVFGASMGGDGVWHLINDYPQYFAAVMAASGAYRGFGLSNIARTPILCTKGTRERKYQEYVQTIEDIKLLGGEVNFQPLKNYDHRSTVGESFTPERIEWVLSHRRKP